MPFGFKKGSGFGWSYTWHKDDPKDEFHFECNECIYVQILGRRKLMKLGSMCCHADIINYSALPYTDFIRTETLCQGGERCDFRFVRHKTDVGNGWERSKSIAVWHPRLSWDRTKTIGRGDGVCDFRVRIKRK